MNLVLLFILGFFFGFWFNGLQIIPSIKYIWTLTSTAESSMLSGTCHLPSLATHSSWESDSSHPIKKYSMVFLLLKSLFQLKKIFYLKPFLFLFKKLSKTNWKIFFLWNFCVSFKLFLVLNSRLGILEGLFKFFII